MIELEENAIVGVVMKTCSKCRKPKPAAEMGKDARKEDGMSSHCKACKAESKRNYYNINRENELEKDRERYRKNQIKLQEGDDKCREKNREKMRAKSERFNIANPRKRLEYALRWQKSNPKKARERNKKWRLNNTEKTRDHVKKWQIANPEKVKLNTQKRRTRKAGLPNSLTLKQIGIILARFSGRCALTGSSDYHMDHVLPLACGHGGTVLENIIPLRDNLNFSKKSSHLFEWFEDNRERFNLEQHKFNELVEYLAQVNGMTTKEYRTYVDWCFDNPVTLSLPQ